MDGANLIGDTKSVIIPERRISIGAPTARSFVHVGMRWRKRMAIVFALIVLTAFPAAFFMQDYQSEMKLLVRKDRSDPLVGPDQTRPEIRQELSETELNAEIELLRSDDVLHNVVLALGLQQKTKEPLWYRLFGIRPGSSEEVRTERAVRKLNSALEITLPKKSDVITIRYSSENPRLAADVLTTLSRIYLEKHLAVRRPPGQFDFFEEQATRYRTKLAEIEGRLAAFPRNGGAVAGPLEVDIAVRKLGDLRLSQQQTQTSLQETEKRIQTLETQMAATQPRMTTAVRTADNPHLMMQLRSTLLNLELKRTELLQKFQPTYREVKEVDQQIANTQAAIATAENAPPRDETTDRDPIYEWLRSELAKARAEFTSLQARAASLSNAVSRNTGEAQKLNESSPHQQDLIREAKTLEDTYQLYLRKSEEARISDALDRSRILNVSIVQKPTVPFLPRRSPWVVVLGVAMAAVLAGVGTAFVSERMDHSLRGVSDVQIYLEIPVLAVLPASETRLLQTGG